jgi:hypothetical protein
MSQIHRGRRWAVGAAVIAILAIPLVASPANAVDNSVKIRFLQPKVTIEYGQEWSTSLRVSNAYPCNYGRCEHVISIFNEGDANPMTTSPIGVYSQNSAYLSNYDLPAQLDVGTYTMSAVFKRFNLGGKSEAPFLLTITPAPISTTVAVTTDENRPSNAVISANLDGSAIDVIASGINRFALPAGEWHLRVTEADGKTAFEKSVAQKAGGSPFISLYWQGVPAGTDFTATAEFTPESKSAANFEISPATDAPYSSPIASGSGLPAASDAPTGPPSDAVAAGPTVPAWALGAGGLIALGALVAITSLAIGIRRARSRPVAESVREGEL